MRTDVFLFGVLPSSPGGRQPLSPRAWTGVGALAIPLWATWPALGVRAAEMPAFQVLAIAFPVGWLTLLLVERPSGTEVSETEAAAGGQGRAWGLPVLACALGLCGNNAFFILATRHMPPAQANLISYLWPVMVVALGGALRLFRLRLRHVIGLVLGFGGAAVVMGDGPLSPTPAGVGLALLAGASWALYCVYRLWQGAAVTNVLARGCAVSAVLCAGLHFLFEPTIMPSLGALSAAVAVGVAPLGLGNLAWDQGFRHGDSQLLAVMAYGTPVLGALLLIGMGLASPTLSLLIGAAMIVGAGLLSRSERP